MSLHDDDPWVAGLFWSPDRVKPQGDRMTPVNGHALGNDVMKTYRPYAHNPNAEPEIVETAPRPVKAPPAAKASAPVAPARVEAPKLDPIFGLEPRILFALRLCKAMAFDDRLPVEMRSKMFDFGERMVPSRPNAWARVPPLDPIDYNPYKPGPLVEILQGIVASFKFR